MENDPIGFAGGQTNLYAGEGDNPTNGSDPTGLWDIADFLYQAKQIPGNLWDRMKQFPDRFENGWNNLDQVP